MNKTLKHLVPLFLLLALMLSACGRKAPAHADLQALYDRLESEGKLPEMIVLNEKKVESYYGIDPGACRQLIVAMSDDGLRVDEIWLIETGSEKEAEALLALAQSRIEQVCTENKDYLPDQYAVAKGSQALRVGSSVALFISPEAKEMAELFTKAFTS